MTTTNTNRKILDLKRWEFVSTAPFTNGGGVSYARSELYKNYVFALTTAANGYLYNPEEDGHILVPALGLGGSFGAGSTVGAIGWSTGATVGAASLTATAGTTTTITTNQTLARDLNGFYVWFMGGTNAGKLKKIASNAIGTNAVITFETAEGAAFDNTSTYRLLTPRFFMVNAGTAAATTFRFYDFATNTIQSCAQNPANAAVDSKLIPCPGFGLSSFEYMASGLATGGTGTTLQNSGKNWSASQWINAQVVITGGTGAGQIRTITANDATSITVSTWGTNPDSTSQYVITGNDDHLYWMGNGAVTLYRYNIAANTWTTLSPSPTARAAIANTGMSGHWVSKVTDSRWTTENSIINGRRLYSFRGNAVATFDYYDIPANTWTNAITYSPATETVSTGSKYVLDGNYLYIQKDSIGRWFRYDFANSSMESWGVMLYTQGGSAVGDTAFLVTYVDGNTTIKYIYMLLNTSTALLRQMVI
jgi:hypothetical protein